MQLDSHLDLVLFANVTVLRHYLRHVLLTGGGDPWLY